ncbi:1-(5-phosphoribosyl)-5-[(5-phosphoribosylamino)methylideneamino]imidazole-4-carboxamide isomerase [bacterium]|nr:1-(5-phosphoribosyl)-5-[(5-phosphoribosylamino)methylideneamino]imidazole-4-carboxamide isomerase [bacterium]
MKLFPAIDLQGGACVRLLHGDFNASTRFPLDPGAQAEAFEAAGFSHLHVVDLDGARAGYPINMNAVLSILEATNASVQLGGGIRDLGAVSDWLSAGVSRVIIGTAAVRKPELVRAAAEKFPGQIVVALDTRGGRVAVDGWANDSDMPAEDLAAACEGSGVAALIVTDISRDGAKTGVNVELTGRIADRVSIPVIASGGVASVDDIRALKRWGGRSIAGVVLGRALYDGDIIPAEALAAATEC